VFILLCFIHCYLNIHSCEIGVLFRIVLVYFTDFVGLLSALHYECVANDAEGMITVAKLEMTDEKWLFIFVIFYLLCLYDYSMFLWISFISVNFQW